MGVEASPKVFVGVGVVACPPQAVAPRSRAAVPIHAAKSFLILVKASEHCPYQVLFQTFKTRRPHIILYAKVICTRGQTRLRSWTWPFPHRRNPCC